MLKKKFIDLQFFTRVLAIAIPMIIQYSITNFVSLLDNIMVGQLGTEAMNGVAISNQLFFIYILAVFGITSSGEIFGAQFYGKGDVEGQKHAFLYKLYLSLAAALMAIAILIVFREPLISLFLSKEGSPESLAATYAHSVEYMNIMFISLVPFAITTAYSSTLKESGITDVPMKATMAAVFTNGILDYVLIFGPGPVPALGVQGAAIATALARFIECSINVAWTHAHPETCRYIKNVGKHLIIPQKLFIKIFINGLPLIVNEILWSASVATLTGCYALRGLNVLAGYNIASVINNLFSTLYFQMGACIAIIVGQLMGAGRLEEAVDADNKISFLTFLMGLSCGVVLATLGRYFPNIYNTDPEVKKIAADFITAIGIFLPIYSLSHSFYFTLRSGGKTFITFLFDSAFSWVVLVPVAVFMARNQHVSLIMMVVSIHMVEVLKSFIGFFMVKSRMWVNNLTT